MILKTKIKTILMIGIILGYSTLFNIILILSMEDKYGISKNETNFKINATILKNSKTSIPIHIIGNSGWVDFKNAGHCTGEGTYSNPYVIEDLVIEGDFFNYYYCILIENSNVYFRIENCDLSGVQSDITNYDAGIVLSYVNNAQLINNICIRNICGISLYYSDNNIISGNTVSKNYYIDCGISLRYSNNNNISRNIITDNGGPDIELIGSNNNIISENTIIGELALYSSNYNNIIKNTCFSPVGECWYEEDCVGNVFIDNYCSPYSSILEHLDGIIILLFTITLILTIILVITKRKV